MNCPGTKILLTEDDEVLGAVLVKVLEEQGYVLDWVRDGQAGCDRATTIAYDLLLLDVQVPKLDGISLCRQLRSRGLHQPILLLTANDSDADVVAGLEAGADDYISKPCANEVLLARIRIWLRRSGALVAASESNSTPALTWGELALDPNSGRVTVGEQVVTLTATEYNLLELFLCHPDRIFSRSVILDRLWGLGDAPSDRAIVTYIKDVRKKLKASGLTEEILETVYGMGYRLKPAPPVSASSLDHSKLPSISNQSSRPPSRTAIDRVLERFRGAFGEQMAVLEQAKNALLTGNLEVNLHRAAWHEAHKLAGSLRSFGYSEGSTLARSLEHLLRQEGLFSPETTARFVALVAALQRELEQEPSASTDGNNGAFTAVPVSLNQIYQVLVIDDDVALTERLQVEADAWGLRLSVAASPGEARSHLNLKPPNVVVLDLSFPDPKEDGFTLLQEITQRFPDLPVIVFTGRDSLVDRLTVFRAGARQFLHKPATTEQIFRTIARVLSTTPAAAARVLIVDDDPGMLALLASMLTPWGLEVTTLSNPQDFWHVLVTTTPNVILLDMEMPQISGLELCQVVRQDPQWEGVPLLVVTAYTDADSLRQAFAAGADDFIAKPVLGPELVTRVISRIERTRLHNKRES